MQPSCWTGQTQTSGNIHLKPRTRSLIWGVAFYLVIGVSAASQPFIFSPDSAALYLSQIAMAIPPGFWMIKDAKARGIFVPHVIQPAVLGYWAILVPIYLVCTRKWWGLLYAAMHVTMTYALIYSIYFGVYHAFWGMD